MPTTTKPMTPMPPPDVALIDPDTGQPTKVFYDLLNSLINIVARLRLEIP